MKQKKKKIKRIVKVNQAEVSGNLVDLERVKVSGEHHFDSIYEKESIIVRACVWLCACFIFRLFCDKHCWKVAIWIHLK